MDNKNESRLGKILIDKNMISQAQLDIAIVEQTRRRENLKTADTLYIESTAMGEVLIDLGFINRLQLKRCLNWQMILRNMTIAMSLCAPLMTFGSGAVAATSSSAIYGYRYSSSLASSAPTSSSVASTSSSSKSSSASSQPSSSPSSSSMKSSSSSKSSSSALFNYSSSSSSMSPVTSASSSSASTVVGPVYLLWNAPNRRENGDYLDITDIGGYELRYRRMTESNFTYVTINDAWSTRYYFRLPAGAYEFQVAVFDKNGIYSQFVNLSPR